MPELPMVLEAIDWQEVMVGAAVVAFGVVVHASGRRALHMFNSGQRPRMDPQDIPFTWFGGLLVGALGLAMLVDGFGWELRVDQNGIALSAPLEITHRGGSVAWTDMRSLDVSQYANLKSSYGLYVNARETRGLMIGSADMLPRQFGEALQKVVAARAPQVTGGDDLVSRIEWARRNSHDLVSVTYSGHDGRGHPLR